MMEPVQSLLRHGFSSRVVQPWGSGANRVLLVGEAPGEVEDATGIPFNQRAPAGGVLHRLLHRGGWEAEDFRIANTVWQRPPRNWLENSPWQTEAIEAWRPALERTIEEMRPRCIVALGGIALQTLTSFSGITASRGYVLHSNYDAWVIGTYHPSFLLPRRSDEVQKGNVNNSHLTGVVIYDIAHALKIANEGFARRPMNLVTHPSLDNFLGFERRYNPDRHVLHYDIETPESGELDEEALEEKESEISYHIIRMSSASTRIMMWPFRYRGLSHISLLPSDCSRHTVRRGRGTDDCSTIRASAPTAARSTGLSSTTSTCGSSSNRHYLAVSRSSRRFTTTPASRGRR
jgi:uracil-DNA glycosylase family 4